MAERGQSSRKTFAARRYALIAAGFLSMSLGVIGAFVPVLPTTPFLLLATACFAKSSERLHRFLLENRVFGDYLRRYRDGEGLPLAVKVATLALLWAGLALSAFWVISPKMSFVRLGLLAVGIGVTVHIAWIKTRRESSFALSPDGRILYLTADLELLRRQLTGEDLRPPPSALLDNISTDEITPAWACLHHDERLGRYALTGLRGGVVAEGALAAGGFEVLVAGRSKGCGSSRETAPFAEKAAGIKLVIAESFEKIYRQNCHNIGLLTSTDLGLLPRLARGEAISLAELTRGLDPITAAVITNGGLSAVNRARLEGRALLPAITAKARPLTLAEQIIARHASPSPGACPDPGGALFCRADVRFSHDYTTAMTLSLLRRDFGPDAEITGRESVYAFRDHLSALPLLRNPRAKVAQAEELARIQREFCAREGIRLYDGDAKVGAEAICHNAMLEEIVLPGQLVIGTDSHTSTAGALGCLAFGVGATDMANAWVTGEVRLEVPRSVLIDLRGRLGPDRTAKDLALYLMAREDLRPEQTIGRVLELTGDGLATIGIDERATVANMAVEAGATTAIFAADEVTWRYLEAERQGLDLDALTRAAPRADPNATYAARVTIELGDVPVMVSTPGDPRNARPLTKLGEVPIDIAYGGSCTGGKRCDMDQYARVLGPAARRGQKIAKGVRLYIQFGSRRVRRYAEERGYCELFSLVGATLLDPACGACIGAGPGVSEDPSEVTVAAINRNFPGRSGPGAVYLASPLVVAASALAGYIRAPLAS